MSVVLAQPFACEPSSLCLSQLLSCQEYKAFNVKRDREEDDTAANDSKRIRLTPPEEFNLKSFWDECFAEQFPQPATVSDVTSWLDVPDNIDCNTDDKQLDDSPSVNERPPSPTPSLSTDNGTVSEDIPTFFDCSSDEEVSVDDAVNAMLKSFDWSNPELGIRAAQLTTPSSQPVADAGSTAQPEEPQSTYRRSPLSKVILPEPEGSESNPTTHSASIHPPQPLKRWSFSQQLLKMRAETMREFDIPSPDGWICYLRDHDPKLVARGTPPRPLSQKEPAPSPVSAEIYSYAFGSKGRSRLNSRTLSQNYFTGPKACSARIVKTAVQRDFYGHPYVIQHDLELLKDGEEVVVKMYADASAVEMWRRHAKSVEDLKTIGSLTMTTGNLVYLLLED